MKQGSRDIDMEKIRKHYEVERELADRLRTAPSEERRHLYSAVYDELYKRVPHHPQLVRKVSPQETEHVVSMQMKFIRPFLRSDITFLEIGPGDCSFSFEVAKYVKQVYAVDVSEEITKNPAIPPNFKLILSDGTNVPLPPNSIDMAYSNAVIEHLHPEDALEQLKNIYNSLKSGGIYICVTPNRLTGPHDISRYFDMVATGFHLKEYTNLELDDLFRNVGFLRRKFFIGARGIYLRVPAYPLFLCERVLEKLPYSIRKTMAKVLPFRHIRIVGIK